MQRARRAMVAAVSVSVALLGSGIAAAHADTTSVLYVDDSATSCTDTGTGIQAAPFCTIQAAANAAVAGDTVDIQAGSYTGAVDVMSQGTAAEPILFQAVGGGVVISDTSGQTGPSLNISGASYVTFEGNEGSGNSQMLAFSTALVNGSSHITLDGVRSKRYAKAIEVTGTSSSVTVSRSYTSEVVVDPGSSADVVTTNDILGIATLPGISVTGASNTEITSNTLVSGWNDDNVIGVSGSTGTSIENNVVQDNNVTDSSFPATGPEAGIAVDSDSAPSTTLDYNVVYIAPAQTPSAFVVSPYSWAGSGYSSASALYQATGQGQHDLNGDPGISALLVPTSSPVPQLNSANASAPGMLSTDIYGHPCEADGVVAVTGVGSPDYCARGAAQPQLTTTVLATASAVTALSVSLNSSIDQTVSENQSSTQYPVTLAAAPLVSYTITWGDGQTQTVAGTSIVLGGTNATHTYTKPGKYTITDAANLTSGGTSAVTTTSFTTAGSAFVPITPIRVMDTRSGLGGWDGPLSGGICYVLGVGGVGSIPSDATAIAANLTVTDTSGNGYFFLGSQGGSNSVLNYRSGQTVENSILAQLTINGGLSICERSAGADAILDVTGYFTEGTGSGYQAVTPNRLLDTRDGIGASKSKVAAHAAVPVTVAGRDSIPDDATAVAVHVTVTDTTGNGWIAAEPDGASGTPTTSTLNYLKGQTIANTVIVPVAADGKIELYNGGGTTSVDLIADVSGYFSAAAPDAFVPIAATRVWDSRTQGEKLQANGTQTYSVLAVYDAPASASVVTNITLTDETVNGFVTAYPEGISRPSTSNLNYFAQQNIGGLSILNTTGPDDKIDVYNHSTGSTDIILDVSGYFANS